MASEFSFDIVSQVDLQEIDNAINQASKEIAMRYDFKGTTNTYDFKREEKKIIITAADDMKLKAMTDILITKGAKRNISPKAFKFKDKEAAFEGHFRQEVELVCELPQESSKQIVKWVKEMKARVQASIQGEKVRISGKSKDDLQAVQQMVRSKTLDVPIQFDNYRG